MGEVFEVFQQSDLDSQAIAASSTIARLDLAAAKFIPFNTTRPTVVITNEGSVTAYVKRGIHNASNILTVSASGANLGMAILSGQSQALRLRPNDTHLAAITASGTTTLNVTLGLGV